MPDYSFRMRFRRAPKDTAQVGAPVWRLEHPRAPAPIELAGRPDGTNLSVATDWILRGSGWESSDAAEIAGRQFSDSLARALALLRIGADWGTRRAGSFVYKAGLQMLERQTGRRVLNDSYGLCTYETKPRPMFASVGDITVPLRTVVTEDRFKRVVAAALTNPQPMTAEERLSTELFGASFFQENADSRFLLLMISIEALLNPPLRSPSAVKLVDRFTAAIQDSELDDSDKASLKGSLRWLRNESISRTGRALVSSRLSGRTYADLRPEKFFSYCYELRSRLVHGVQPVPTQPEIARATGPLEVMVSHLLAGELLHRMDQLW